MKARLGAALAWPTVTVCQCFSLAEATRDGCVCPDIERVMRAWSRGVASMPAMTEEQRAWCLSEIRAAGDATSQPDDDDLTSWSDKDYAHSTLIAWQDYCRDKGLI